MTAATTSYTDEFRVKGRQRISEILAEYGMTYQGGRVHAAGSGAPAMSLPCLARGGVQTQQSARIAKTWLEFPIANLPAIIKNLAKTAALKSGFSVVQVRQQRADGSLPPQATNGAKQ